MEVVYSPREQVRPPPTSPWAGFNVRDPSSPAAARAPLPVAWAAGPGRRQEADYPWQLPAEPPVSPGGIRHAQMQQYAPAYDNRRTQEQVTATQDATAAVARYVAGPYQKDAAQRSAQRAIVPWAPYGAGVGERVGSLMAAHGPASGGLLGPPWNQQPPQAVWQGWPAENAGQGWKLLPAGQAPIGQQGGAPGQQAEGAGGGQAGPGPGPGQQQQRPATAAGALGAEGMQPYEGLYHPSPAQAEAYDRVAGRIARAGTDQVGTPTAWGPVPHFPSRQLWAHDIIAPPRYCTGCRGEHDPSKERDPMWQPYDPETRLKNLRMLASKFKVAARKATLDSGRPALCCKFEPGSHVRPINWLWTRTEPDGGVSEVTPDIMSESDFVEQLALMYEGLREGHEPYRHLATITAQVFLDTGSPFIVKAVPKLVRPLRLGLQTYEPHLAGHMMYMLQKLLRSHPGVGPALRPHLKHLLPYMGLFRSVAHNFTLHLPPPFCVPSTGCFSGKGKLPGEPEKSCQVCGVPLNKLKYDNRAHKEKEQYIAAKAANNAHFYEPEAPTVSRLIKGRRSSKYNMRELVDSTCELLVQLGGPGALRAVQHVIPRYCYFDPK